MTKISDEAKRNLKLVWWAAMVAAIFWTLLYRLGAEASFAADFVYVNF